MPKMTMAVDLELSDIIKEARAAQMKIAKSQIQQNVEQTKKSCNEQKTGEQNAVETISKEEIQKIEQNNPRQ